MIDQVETLLQPPTEEEQRRATEHFQYAHRAAVGGDFSLAVQFLRSCCDLAPANLAYRQALRKAEKAKYKNNLRGGLFAPLASVFDRARMASAARKGDHRKVMEHCEAVLARNPWDKGAQLRLAEAADALELPLLAVWTLQQAREKYANDAQVNRALARLLEKQGHYNQAIQLWELVRKAVPSDNEAQHKVKQLGATETIARGNYGEAILSAATAETTTEEAFMLDTPPPKTRKVETVKAAAKPAAQRAPAGPDDYLSKAAAYSRKGQHDEAKAVLKKGLAALGEVPALTAALDAARIEQKKQKLAGIEKQLKSQPQDEGLRKSHADLAIDVNARELAHYRKRVEGDPGDNALRFELGVRLLRAGEIDAAIGEFQALRSDVRLRWRAHFQLGHCFEARGNWPLARRNFDEALKLLPGGDEATKKELLLHLAKGHAGAGEYPRAIELALDLADMDFAYGDVGKLLDEWQKRAGRESASP